VKWRLLDNQRVVGDFAVQPMFKLPSGLVSSGSGSGTTDGSLLLISSRAFGPVSMDVNYGFTWRTGDGVNAPRRASVWAIAAGGPVHGSLGWTSEVFGYPRTHGPAGAPSVVALIEGATFEVRPWLVLDGGATIPLVGGQPRAVFAGAVYNIGRFK
jgi:hypothetical protein